MTASIDPTARLVFRRWLCALGVLLSLTSGCATTRWAKLRRVPTNPLTQQLELNSRDGPRPTERTLQALRRFDLEPQLDGNPAALVAQMQTIALQEPVADNVYSLAELAYIGARKAMDAEDRETALNLYSTAVVNAYFYLFDDTFANERSAFDPRFRRACDLYNNALENAIRLAMSGGNLRPGGTLVIETPRQVFEFSCANRGTHNKQHFDNLKFVSDFQVKELSNQFRNYGLGVPMIALYEPNKGLSPADRFYPPGASFPVTAFLRVLSTQPRLASDPRTRYRCSIELHDTTASSEIEVGGTTIPLETDLTTPLAYSLDNPVFRRANVPLKNLLAPEESAAVSGLYMLEPYNPNKIPVLMVHGFWSSLITWMEMFNDLRGSEEIRDNYQFWFYLYPTGQPFWYSAARLRTELADLRNMLDPQRVFPALDQMVLVGHSMGGLIAQTQTIESGHEFWKLVSPYAIDQMVAPDEVKANAMAAMYFQPNMSIQRVVTIATPHRGSNFSNLATQWLGRKLINMPDELERTRNNLLRNNPNYFPPESLIHITSAVDALAPEAPVLAALHEAQRAPWVRYHNIIGLIDETQMLKSGTAGSDGIVERASAHLEHAVSEILVPAPHTKVHQHPRTIFEVRRILLEHLNQSRANQPPGHLNGLQLTMATSASTMFR